MNISISLIMAFGILVVVVLSAIAWHYHNRVRKMEAAKREQLEEIDRLKSNHQHYLNNSIQILAQGLIDEQLSLTEGSIRISVLMDNLKVSDDYREEFSAFFQLADATVHIPILNAWKKLPKKDKLRFEKERTNTEEKYKEFVIDAAKRIKDKAF